MVTKVRPTLQQCCTCKQRRQCNASCHRIGYDRHDIHVLYTWYEGEKTKEAKKKIERRKGTVSWPFVDNVADEFRRKQCPHISTG